MTVKISAVQASCLRVINSAGAISMTTLNRKGFGTVTVTRLQTMGLLTVKYGIVQLTDEGKRFTHN